MVFAWYALLYTHSSFAITLKGKRELVAFLLLSYGCLVIVYVLWLFLKVPWMGLQCVVVVFPDHTHLHLLDNSNLRFESYSVLVTFRT